MACRGWTKLKVGKEWPLYAVQKQMIKQVTRQLTEYGFVVSVILRMVKRFIIAATKVAFNTLPASAMKKMTSAWAFCWEGVLNLVALTICKHKYNLIS